MRTAKKWFVVAVSALVMVGCGAEVGEAGSTRRGVVVAPTLEGPVDGRRLVCADLDVGLNQLYTDVISFEEVTFPHVVNFADTDSDPGPLEVELTFASSKMFSWTSNVGVDHVLVGQTLDFSTFVYTYAPEATAGEDLVAPEDQDILYVKFCYDPDEEDGCTRTQGYWKTHSKYGPAPHDETWALVGEDTAFFLSGKSYHEVLQTPPRGNPYYILAKQFIAAKLNGLAGASLDDVSEAMADAEELFDGTEPGDARAIASQFLTLAIQLTDYNEGETGPGHCDTPVRAE